jgi:hypothetical protein
VFWSFFVFFVFFWLFCVFCSYGVRDATDLIEEEAAAAVSNTEEIMELIDEIKTDYDPFSAYDNSYFEPVNLEAVDFTQHCESWSDGVYSFEVARFVWIWLHILLTMCCMALTLAGYFPFKKAGYLISSTVILFFAFAFLFLHLAYFTSELIVMVDVCEQVSTIFINLIDFLGL